MAVATPSNSSPQKSRYAYIVIIFITFVLFTVFVFNKRALEPSFFLYKNYFTQIPLSSSSTNNTLISLSQSNSAPILDPPSSLLQSTSITPPTHEPSSQSESNDENVQDPNRENENVQDPDGGNESSDLKNESSDQNGGENENPDVEMGEIPCDLYAGTWVRDEKYPLYKPGSCPHVDEAFDCQSNGRGDSEYLKWRWKPDGCDLPRFNATDFLVRLRGKRLMLVGDSMNRNQFESILCLLREGLHNKSRMYEIHGHKISKGRGYFSFKFQDYDCTVDFVLSHFLVKEGVRFDEKRRSNPTLSIDQIDRKAKRWMKADILVFNTGHWWAHGKTARGKNYYKEGDYLYPHFDVTKAFKPALKTWASWVDLNVNPKKQLIFYRGYSSSHFRGGDWDSGGSCKGEKEPAFSGALLDSYPLKMKIVDEVIKEMKVPVILLNVTRLTNCRKDGHPSIWGKKGSSRKQDCSHWCVPGVPDAWNELIYATLVFQQKE
ncbi:hypothetical protein ACLB2K_038222 [Fragaria x ananassa]